MDGDTGPSLSYTKSMSRRENELSTAWQLFLQSPLKADRQIYPQAHLVPGHVVQLWSHPGVISPLRETVKHDTVTNNLTPAPTRVGL